MQNGAAVLATPLPRPETPQVQLPEPVRAGNAIEPPSLAATTG